MDGSSLEISLPRRKLLNFLTGGTLACATVGALYSFVQYLIPPTAAAGAGGSVIAKDKLGKVIPASQVLVEAPGTRALVAGVAGLPTYLTVKEGGTLDELGLVDICTHLGCTFPWNGTDQQFQCPCHGSRYAADGTVIRGPADRPLQLVRVRTEGGVILIEPWLDLDPRTGKTPWWV